MPGPFPVTTITASVLGLVLIFLAYRCVAGRLVKLRSEGADAVDAAETAIAHAMRVMGNFAEYVPMALILLLCLEAMRVDIWLLHGIAGVFVLARLMHAWGFARNAGTSAGRFWGTLLTWIVIVLQSAIGLYMVVVAG